MQQQPISVSSPSVTFGQQFFGLLLIAGGIVAVWLWVTGRLGVTWKAIVYGNNLAPGTSDTQQSNTTTANTIPSGIQAVTQCPPGYLQLLGACYAFLPGLPTQFPLPQGSGSGGNNSSSTPPVTPTCTQKCLVQSTTPGKCAISYPWCN